METTFKNVVDELSAAGSELIGIKKGDRIRHEMPSRDSLSRIVEGLRSVLFPGYFGPSELTTETMNYHIGSTLDWVFHALRIQIMRGLCSVCMKEDPTACRACSENSALMTKQFMERLPGIRRLLAGDVDAAYKGDPALINRDEAIFCYPGLQAITNQRLAHELRQLGVPLIPRIITELAHSATGIDIHPGARIGEEFFIDHGTGVVIGETCIIGNRVRIYQGVTLGAKSFPLDEKGNPMKGIDRHPLIEDDVIVYSGATILGRVTIGKGSIIGGNVWLTRNVAAGSVVTQAEK